MRVLTAAQMREVDRLTTERYGVPSIELMENAGTRVVELIREKVPDLARKSIVVLCGKGRNGGDGLVVARLLKGLGANVSVLLFGSPEPAVGGGDAAVNLKRWRDSSGELHVVSGEGDWDQRKGAISEAEIVVDALLGTGLRGAAEGLLARVIEDVNTLASRAGRGLVVSVDVPSGLLSDGESARGPVIRADYTVTFTAPKLGLLISGDGTCAGTMVVRGIGTPPELLEKLPGADLHWLEPEEFRGLPLSRSSDAHKGDFGHALIVAGSRGKSGAAALAAWGALRAGAGLVTVATPEGVLPVVAGLLPEMMTEPLAETPAGSVSLRSLDYGCFQSLAEGKSCLALGPGLSTHPETQEFVRSVVSECPLPVILDADGLNAFEGRATELARRGSARRGGEFLAVTPHPGEMARLLGCPARDVQARRLDVAREAARRWNACVILKGFRTIVASPAGATFINSTGNAGMATAGTGDVLTGILAGLTAQFGTAQWERVLAFGVYLHGLAGDLAARDVGQAPMIASDLVAALPRAYRAICSAALHGRQFF